MEKRKVGERAEILVDSIDLQILEVLENSEVGIGVLELAHRLNINHNSIKPHLEKLMRIKLILSKQGFNRKIFLLSPSSYYATYINEIHGDDKWGKEFKDYRTKFNNFLEILNKINNLGIEKQTLYEINEELERYDLNMKAVNSVLQATGGVENAKKILKKNKKKK